MVSQRCDAALYVQLIEVLSGASAPLTASEVRCAMAASFNVYVINGALEEALVELERRGKAVMVADGWRLRRGVRRASIGGTVIADGEGDCVKILDGDGRLLYVNAEGCRALGLTPGQADFGMPWLDLLPSEFRRQGLRALHAAMGGTRSCFVGVTGEAGAGRQRWKNVLTPLEGADGLIHHVICVSQDVTHLPGEA